MSTGSLGLTFAGLHTLKPAVTELSIADASIVFIPGTSMSATTDSTGFLERAAVWTYYYCQCYVWGHE